ncbi:excinuclease ABC subunit UvrC [Phascolarctobacterium succinatutens]|jgi:excinuclease ABC subunit C|uniref:excinuclease ABC subunit UvrC n=1 Tax=Phascolarctobacterium succinatutens TaxID=626940 RepID=UPI0023F2D344|nr:excinuclease ABC subunit UvrC [Phascolarctobacterium succinatutens]MCI6544031.1 excinuclease ABC subunit UvrC [Phascolarctobacterium succinatutens]
MTELAAGFSDNIKNALAVLPEKPGVYLMHDASGKVIYVGKAVVLKNRVRSYFRNLASHTPKVKAMVAKIAEIETIVTSSEVEALILECNLIKKYRPRYNISLKDDKTYPYLKVTMQEDFPRLYVTRRQLRDGARYYGPYADAGAMHATVKLLRSMFPLRTCRKMNPDRPCLNYHIKRCLAPCAGYISKADYHKMIKSICMVLDGRTTELERDLKQQMQEAADNYAFEEAARLRDQLQAVARLNEAQKAVTNNGGDMDIFGLGQDMTGLCVQLFFVRKGKLIGRDNFFLPDGGDTPQEVMTAFVKQYYNEATFIPKEVVLPYLPEEDEKQLIETWLADKAQRRVELLLPQRGVKKDLLKLANENAVKLLNERLRKGSLSLKNDLQAAEELQQALGLEHPLERMDCFDISHTQGSETVASMVVFRNGTSSKKDYRRYKIVSAEGKPDDFKSMQEVVYRRYRDYEDLPSLVVIDGGKGQLSSALEVIRGLGLDDLPVVGLAKREEEIFKPHQSESIMLDREGAALHLIQRIRDEAHRFAITYHRKLRGKRNLVSVLDHVEGIGAKRRQELWKAFKTLDAMRAASVEELAAVEGMNHAAAQTLYDFFRLDLPEKQQALQ